MKRIISIFSAACLLIAAGCGTQKAGLHTQNQVTLVQNGRPVTSVDLPQNATPSQQLAVREFVKYVKQMTGATLPVKSTGDPSLVIPSLETAYQMLDSMGCRFLAPQFDFYDGSVEVIPTGISTLVLKQTQFPEPKLTFRKLYVEEGHSHNIENLKQLIEWMPKVGYNTLVVPMNYQGHGKVMWDNWRDELTPELQKRGITIEVGGHGYQNFINADMEGGKLFDQHPDWFGMDANGNRRREPNYVFCTSNDAAINYFIDHFIVYIKAHPEIQVYDFWPPDGARWCECDECKKLGTPSDREAILLRKVAERVKQVRPDLRLEIIAYNAAIDPPEHQTIDKNILVDFCPINQQFDHQINDPAAEINANYVAELKAWRSKFAGDISLYSYYRKYAWDSLPVELPHYLQKDLQFYATVPVQGVSTYCEPGDWATYELNHYMLAALARDPNANVDAIEKKFCDARYGPAGNDARDILNMLENVVRNDCAIPNSSLKSADEIDHSVWAMYDALDQVGRDMAALKDGPYKQALARLQLMLQYAQRDLIIQKLRAVGAADDDVRKQLESLHDWLTDHEHDGVFLVSDQRASLQRMLRRYGIKDRKDQ